ncbi:MAG: YgjV family protein [Defluviitaleaceae bacterium]|nr:YgjV family protein [Defluviitaleaceae bacterium]MCL2262635.1 YgjV family protein [Defluviitaleaceae bacterium]
MINTWYIIAQILGVITIGFEFASYQIKDKTKYFLITGIGSFFWMLMFFAIGVSTGMGTQLSLIVAAIYSTIRNIVFWRIFSKNTPESKEAGLNFLLAMIVIAIVAGVFTVLNAPEQVRWLHILGLVVALGFVIGQYLPGVHYVRIAVVFYAIVVMLTQTPINILYGDFRWNIMGILIETAKIASVVIFYVRYSSQPKQAQLVFAKP